MADEGLKDLSNREWKRVMELMEELSTVTERSYTNPYNSHYGVIRSKLWLPAVDRSKEAEMKFFKMNGWTEYQAVYDRYALKKSTDE
ncbi:Hypothetical protein CINCED_3A019341 [Cinara cedri]|uniref:Uncharacterized protein n=1 Tax=Cinara cedri TaxID=506608 RepID=A0A5E4N0P2_9HEMI|nr:Hypothetical protein CINCED_3A019341 [Cinara cedri]